MMTAGGGMDLTISDPALVGWLGGGGVRLDNTGASKVVLYNQNPAKFSNAVTGGAPNAFSVELWVAPLNIAQRNAHIFSVGPNEQCPTTNLAFIAASRALETITLTTPLQIVTDGTCAGLRSYAAEFAPLPLSAAGRKTHYVWTFDGSQHIIYVNGDLLGGPIPVGAVAVVPFAGTVLTFGNVATGCTAGACSAATVGADWSGDIYMAAVYGTALSQSTAIQLFNIGSDTVAFVAGAVTSAGTIAMTTAPMTTTVLGQTFSTPGTIAVTPPGFTTGPTTAVNTVMRCVRWWNAQN